LYLGGNTNLFLTIPHGGRNTLDIPDPSWLNFVCKPCLDEPSQFRSNGCDECIHQKQVMVLNANTAEMALVVYKQIVTNFKKEYGEDYLPHMLISMTTRK
jgi:hypothetical protein